MQHSLVWACENNAQPFQNKVHPQLHESRTLNGKVKLSSWLHIVSRHGQTKFEEVFFYCLLLLDF